MREVKNTNSDVHSVCYDCHNTKTCSRENLYKNDNLLEAGERSAYKTEKIAIGKYRNMIEMQQQCRLSLFPKSPSLAKADYNRDKNGERPLGPPQPYPISCQKSFQFMYCSRHPVVLFIATNFSFYWPLESRCMVFDSMRYRYGITMDDLNFPSDGSTKSSRKWHSCLITGVGKLLVLNRHRKQKCDHVI